MALAAGAILIVDEAGMVGTRDLAILADAARCAQAKLVLVGDDRQLPEIQAGGAFRALSQRLGAVELREIRRQREGWDREALAALRDGDAGSFARAYQEHGRLIAAPTAGAARAAMVDDWYAAHVAGAAALMIAHRRRDVALLNAEARERMRASGRIGGDEMRADKRAFACGDRIVTTRNDRALGVVNGQTGVVAGLRAHGLDVQFDDGRCARISERYMRDGHLDHGYATTAHRAQGATVDRVFVLGSDELYREWGYTALSRHRDSARFYVTAAPTFLNQAPAPLQAGRAVALRAAEMLDASRSKQLASGDGQRQALEDAHGRLRATESRLAALQSEHRRTRWYQRSRRADVERHIGACRAERRERLLDVERLARRAELLAAVEQPTLRRGRDPLAPLDFGRHRDQRHDLGREL